MAEPESSIKIPPLIEVQGVVKYFPIHHGLDNRTVATVHAVENVSFDIQSGETLGLVGESGSGKTTLGRVLLRAIEPTSGRVFFNVPSQERVEVTDLLPRELRSFRRHMQMVFQDPYSSLNPRMTVRDTISEPSYCQRRDPAQRGARPRLRSGAPLPPQPRLPAAIPALIQWW